MMATLRESYPSHRPKDVIPGWRPEEGLPPVGFGDKPWREEMAGLEEESTAIRGETEEILGRIKERYTPEQISAAKERLAGRRRPPEGYQIPEFSDVGRERYEQGIFREIEESHGIPGGNPFKIDPTEAVDQAMATQWPKRFEQITNLPFAYADELEGKDLKLVNAERLRFKAEVFAKAERKLKYAKDYHTYAMSKYDTQRKAYEGKLEQERKEALKPPETEVRYNEVTEQNEIWEWKPEFGKWVNTERVKKEKPKEAKPPGEITKEKFKIAKAISASTYRTALTGDERDTTVFQANAALYNKTNQRNEVAYWQTLGREKTNIVKIPIENIKDGWTPEKLQEAAYAKGITIEQVLGELGIIKLPIELMKPRSVRLPIPKE